MKKTLTVVFFFFCTTTIIIFSYGFKVPAFIGSPSLQLTQKNALGKGAVGIEQFGAKANDPKFDNAPAIIKALNAASVVIIPAHKNFTILSPIQVENLASKTLIATNSTIINRNYDARTFLFINCSAIKIEGGLYTRDVLPTIQNGKAQSTIGFQNCKNITVTHVHINGSPEMGIDNNIVIGGMYSYNIIEHCLRDGIYAHYSANLNYIANSLNEIKDDALSMHDYGLDNQKTMLHQAGFTQAGHSVIKYNKISNSVQGISSIGCTDLLIADNDISKTVNAGICIFNSEDLYPNSTARVKNISILNNRLISTGFSVLVNTLDVENNAQNASGRSAIFVACNRQGQSFTTSAMRSSNVSVLNNTVSNCAVNGITLYNIDGVFMKGNRLLNCHSDTKNSPEATGDIAEVINCTKMDISGNEIVDNRKVPLHKDGYYIKNSTGKFLQGTTKGFLGKPVIKL